MKIPDYKSYLFFLVRRFNFLHPFLPKWYALLVYQPREKDFFDECLATWFILLAPATGKPLSSGQRIRITGISPLRGSLRAVSGSTIIILAVIACMRSCLMVCDGILARPPMFQKGHRVPHKWLSSGLMSQCLAIQLSMYSRSF